MHAHKQVMQHAFLFWKYMWMISREAETSFHSLLVPSTPAGWKMLPSLMRLVFQIWKTDNGTDSTVCSTNSENHPENKKRRIWLSFSRFLVFRTHLCPRDFWSPPCGLEPFGPVPWVSPPSFPSPSGPSSSPPGLSSPLLLWPMETVRKGFFN